MRKWLYEAVKSCPGQQEFSAGRVMTTGSVEGPGGVDDAPDKPFIVIRLSTADPFPGTSVKQQRGQVWLHDNPGSLLDTDGLCEALADHVPAQAPAVRPEAVIMECEYEETSGDGFDDHFQTDTRYVTFRITYKPTPAG